MSKTPSIVDDVRSLFGAAGFEVREPSDLDPQGQFAIAGSIDAAGVLVESVLDYCEKLAAPALQVIDAPRVEDDSDLKYSLRTLLLDNTRLSGQKVGDLVDVMLGFFAAHVARQAQPTDRDAVQIDADRWLFMMKIADSEDGPEAQALDSFDSTFDSERPKSVQLAEMVDSAILIVRSGSTTEGAAHADQA